MRKVGGQGLPGGGRVGGGAGRIPPRSTANSTDLIVSNPPTDLHRISGFRTDDRRAGDERDGLRRDDRPGRPLRLHWFSAAERYPVDFFPRWPAPDPAESVKNPGTRTASADSGRCRKAARPAGRAAIRIGLLADDRPHGRLYCPPSQRDDGPLLAPIRPNSFRRRLPRARVAVTAPQPQSDHEKPGDSA